MTHATGGSVQALFSENLNNWYGLPAQGVAVDDFADDNFDHSSVDFIGGGNLFVYSDRRPIGAASMNTFGKAPQWGSAWKAFVKQNADRWHGAYIQKTTLPYEDNYLDLDPDGEGSARLAGVPHHGGLQGQRAQSRGVRRRQDGAVVSRGRARSRSCGIRWARWGRRRTRTAARAWATTPKRTSSIGGASRTRSPNLGVLGASVMGTSGSHNPTLTVQALAWRTAEYLIKNWKTVVVPRDRRSRS